MAGRGQPITDPRLRVPQATLNRNNGGTTTTTINNIITINIINI